jgi:hypothetical protein
MTSRVGETSESTSYQISLAASYVRTHFIVNDLILQGDLVEALTLVRKQLESLTRLHELDTKPVGKLTGKVPNVRNVFKAAGGRVYGDLSEVAHFAKPRVGELLHVVEDGALVGPSLLPAYTDRSHACFNVQAFVTLYFLAWLVEKLPSWYPGYDNANDRLLVGYAVVIAKDAGLIQVMDDEPPSSGEPGRAS